MPKIAAPTLLLSMLATLSLQIAPSREHVLKLAITRDGTITADGVGVSADALSAVIWEVRQNQGEVWLYKEETPNEQQPNVFKVLNILAQFDVPVRISASSDYSELNRRNVKSISVKSIGDAATVVVAVCALVATFWQITTTRRHNRLSVRPLLKFTRYYASAPDVNLGLYIENYGVGPAIIHSTTIKHASLGITTNMWTEFNKILHETNFRTRLHWYEPHDVVPAGKDHFYLILFDKNNVSGAEQFTKLLNEMDIVIEYSSIYGEMFSCDNRSLKDA